MKEIRDDLNSMRKFAGKQRADVHRPSAINPADYEYQDCYPPLTADPDGSWLFRCDHCGHWPCLYGVIFKHLPTGEEIIVGDTCAGHIDIEGGRAAYEARRHRIAVRNAWEKMKMNAEAEQQMVDNPDVDEFLQRCNVGDLQRLADKNDFIFSLVSRRNSGRPLSDKQLEAVKKFVTRQAEFDQRDAERRAAEPPAGEFIEGRRMVQGEILTTKEQDGFDGGLVTKMLVKLDDGNKVWGTVPMNILEAAGDWYMSKPSIPGPDVRVLWEDDHGYMIEGEGTRGLRGKRIEFTAAFEVSRDDEHFGFYKRPTKSRLLES